MCSVRQADKHMGSWRFVYYYLMLIFAETVLPSAVIFNT